MYEAMDILHEHASVVEKALFFETATLFNLSVDLIFYDTTTASFHTDDEDDSERHPNATLRKFGHSKEGTWTPQVVVALAVTREGIPVRSWVFPGNTADVRTVEQIRSDLRGWKLGRVMWAGLCSGNNESAGKRNSGRSPVSKHHLKSIMIEIAWAAVKKKGSYYRYKYWRLRFRLGPKKAIVAIAHRIIKVLYAIIKHGERYKELDEKYFEERSLTNKLSKIRRAAKACGFDLVAAAAE